MNRTEEQIQLCLYHMERLSTQLATNQSKPILKMMEFGYYSGKLSGLFESLNVPNAVSGSNGHLSRCLRMIDRGLPDKPEFDEDLIDYGFAVGHLEQLTLESREKWWEPLLPLVETEQWTSINNIGRANASSLLAKFNKKINWEFIRQETFDGTEHYGMEHASEEFLKQ